MKIKELPLSLYHSLYLRYGSLPTIHRTLPVIVSLTSIPSRLSSLDIVIASLLEQERAAQLVILWLNDELRECLPQRLIKLQSNFFEIRFCEGTSSYRKLLPSLKAYPNSIIVTCDDDMIYPKNWLNNLYKTHLKYPEFVVSQVGRLITRNINEQLDSYKNWTFIRYEYSEKCFLPIGYGGVLYPVNTFDKRVFDEELYMKLTPKADDLWFKALAFLNGKKAYCASEKARPIPILRSQKMSLNSGNIDDDRNRVQWNALCEYFPELRKM